MRELFFSATIYKNMIIDILTIKWFFAKIYTS